MGLACPAKIGKRGKGFETKTVSVCSVAVWLLKRGVLGDDELVKVVCGMMRSHLGYEGPSYVREGPSEA